MRTDLSLSLAPRRKLLRLLSCIRFDEVLVLQGAPMIGALLAMQSLSLDTVWRGTVFLIGDLLLVAHIFVINDWAGIAGDARDPARSSSTFLVRGANRTGMAWLAAALLVSSLLVMQQLGSDSLFWSLIIVGLSALYSVPRIHLKGFPGLNSLLHLFGGFCHFVLGYVTFAPLDLRSAAVGVFFGLVFAAGHLMHETRGFEGDRLNGIQTNAVYFGQTATYIAGSVLFAAAYVLLLTFTALGMFQKFVFVSALFFALHFRASWKCFGNGLASSCLLELQRLYRWLYAMTGALISASIIFQKL